VRKQVELLKHHSDLGTNLLNILEVVRQLDAVDDNRPLLMHLEPIERADEGGLA